MADPYVEHFLVLVRDQLCLRDTAELVYCLLKQNEMMENVNICASVMIKEF
jgi:hypothetical protein